MVARLPSVSPYVDIPLKSVTHGQCDARPTVALIPSRRALPLLGVRVPAGSRDGGVSGRAGGGRGVGAVVNRSTSTTPRRVDFATARHRLTSCGAPLPPSLRAPSSPAADAAAGIDTARRRPETGRIALFGSAVAQSLVHIAPTKLNWTELTRPGLVDPVSPNEHSHITSPPNFLHFMSLSIFLLSSISLTPFYFESFATVFDEKSTYISN